MRILLVGAGGVGDAIAKIAARRDFFEAIVVSDYDLVARRAHDRAGSRRSTATQGGRFVAAQIDASDPDNVAAVAREHGATHVMNAVEPKFVPTIFAGRARRRRRLPRHGDEPVRAASRRPVQRDRRQARRRPVRAGARLGDGRPPRARRHGRRARTQRRVRALRRRPPVLRDRRARHPRRREPRGARRGGQRDLRPVVQHLDHDRGVPQPAGDLGEGHGLVHHAAVLASPRSSTSPRASARSSASTSSTRRCCSCRAGSTPSA